MLSRIANEVIHKPLRTLRRAGMIFAIGIIAGLIIPGYLKYNFGVFDDAGVIAHLPKDAKERWDSFQKQRQGFEVAISAVDNRVFNQSGSYTPSELAALSDEDQKLRSALARLDSDAPIHVAPFYLDPLMFVWPIFYVSMGWLLFMFHLPGRVRGNALSFLLLLFGTLIAYRWPTWIRNMSELRAPQRVVYAAENIDVSKGAFWVQEGQAFAVCVLIVLLWWRWAHFTEVWRTALLKYRSGSVTPAVSTELLEDLTKLFLLWQVCSFFLALAFLPYSMFFWDYVINLHDLRYLIAALTMHGLWGISWLLISLPLVLTWYEWRVKYVLRVQTEGFVNGRTDDVQSPDVPISSLNVVGSLLSAILTFGAPILKHFVG